MSDPLHKTTNSNEPINKTYTKINEAIVTDEDKQSITMLAVPRSWTRLVRTTVILLMMIVGLVMFIVFMEYRFSQANTDRIMNLQKEIEQIKGRLPKEQEK
jgi:hypothetical protein